MHQTQRFLLSVFGSIATFAAVLNTAAAQEVSAPGGYQFFVTPYLWMASVHVTTATPLERRPEVNSNVSFYDLLSHLDGAPFMGSGEIRYGQIGFLMDAIHLPVSTRVTTHDIFYGSGNAELAANTGTGIALYRVVEDPVQFADAGIGLTAYGDVGGFGVGAHTDWQVLGTVDYTLSPSWNLHLGYRSLNFSITGSEGSFGFDVHLRGPFLAGTFRF